MELDILFEDAINKQETKDIDEKKNILEKIYANINEDLLVVDLNKNDGNIGMSINEFVMPIMNAVAIDSKRKIKKAINTSPKFLRIVSPILNNNELNILKEKNLNQIIRDIRAHCSMGDYTKAYGSYQYLIDCFNILPVYVGTDAITGKEKATINKKELKQGTITEKRKELFLYSSRVYVAQHFLRDILEIYKNAR